MKKERLRGVNLGGWFSQVDCIQEKDPEGFPGVLEHIRTFLEVKDFSRIRQAGFNHVRLPVDYFNLFETDTLKPKEEVFLLLDKALKEIQEADLDVILDLHKCPGHDFHLGCSVEQPFFTDPAARKGACDVWAFMAERYAGDNRIMMELLNEPAGQDSLVWDKVKDELFWSIRKHAPKNTIVIGSNKWNSPREFDKLTPVDDDNVIYSFHTYTPVTFTHQGAAWISDPFFKIKRPWPGDYAAPEQGSTTRLDVEFGKWDKDRLQASIQNALDFRAKYDLPVACNEFGVYVQVARQYQIAWMRDFLDILREADVGYSYWNYKNLDFGLISKGESLHNDLPQYNNPDRLDSELMGMIANG
ncbi:MAG: glycoside hydrolase family 5 protein [Fibrobacteraceae bacterium]|nr:glycoside hydrolase family 5 protein [Fibrobacteraceae bacterium]